MTTQELVGQSILDNSFMLYKVVSAEPYFHHEQIVLRLINVEAEMDKEAAHDN
jgi:hypothetical protein